MGYRLRVYGMTPASLVPRMLFTLFRAFLTGDYSHLSPADYLSLTITPASLQRIRIDAMRAGE